MANTQTTRDTLLRFLIGLEGEEQLKTLTKNILEVGEAGEKAQPEVAGFLKEIADANRLKKASEQFRDLRTRITEVQKEYQDTRKRVSELGEAMLATENPTKRQTREFESARVSLEKHGNQLTKLMGQYRSMKGDLESAGLSTTNLAKANDQLNQKSALAVAGLQRLEQAVLSEKRAADEAATAAKARADIEKDLVDQIRLRREALTRAIQDQARKEAAAQQEIVEVQKRREEMSRALIAAQAAETAAQVAAAQRTRDALRAQLAESDAAYRRQTEAARRSAEAVRGQSDALARYRAGVRETVVANSQLAQSSDGLRAAMGPLRAVLAGVLGYLTFHSAVQGVRNLISVGDAAERARIQLGGLYKDQQLGNLAFDKLQELARKTGVQMQVLLDGAVRLKSFGLEPLDGTLAGLIDQNARLGGNMDRLRGIILAVGQAWAKQKLQGEEILQLVERGVPVWDLLAKVTGKNGAELQEMSRKGQITRDIMEQLFKAIAENSKGAAAENLKTFGGLFALLQERIQRFYLAVNDAGVLDYFKNTLKEAIAAIDEAVKNGSFQEWARKVSDALITIADAVKGTIQFIWQHTEAIKALAAAYAAVKLMGFVTMLKAVRLEMIATTAAASGLGTASAATAAGGVSKLASTLLAIPRLIKFSIVGIGIEVALGQIFRLMDAIEQYNDTQRDLALAQGALASTQQDLNLKIEQWKKLYADAAKEAVLSSDQVTAATRNQLEVFALNTEGAIKYYRALYLEAKKAEDGFAMTEARSNLIRLEDQLKAIQNQLVLVAEETKKSATRFSEFSTKAAAEFDKLINKGKSVRQAVDGMFDGLDLTTSEGLKKAVEVLEQVGARGGEAAKVIEQEFRKALLKLKDEDLEAFRLAAANTFADGSKQAELFQMTLDKISFDKLGVDIEAIKTGFTDAGRVAIDAFNDVLVKLEDLGLTAEQQSQVVATAFDKAFSAATTKKEIEALKAALMEAFNNGQISATEFRSRIEQVNAKLSEMGATGVQANQAIANSSGAAAEGLENVAAAADTAASSTADAGDAAASAAQDNRDMADATELASVSLGGMSQAAAETYAALNKYAGAPRLWIRMMNGVTQHLKEQQEQAARRIAQLDEEMARYDPMAQKLEMLRAQYGMLDDATLQEIAQREERLAQMRERSEREAEQAKKEREKAEAERIAAENARRQKQAEQREKEGPAPSGGLGTFNVNVNAVGGTVSKEELARAARELAPMIVREIQFSQKNSR
jgi:tape measure domain-containing protein